MKGLFRLLSAIAFSLAFCSEAGAQYYTLGADPSSTRWSIIRGDNFNVIYPRGMDSLAREYLYNFELERVRTQVGLKIDGAHVPLVLHTDALTSNATVVWAPRRVDIYTTPPFNRGYADDWTHQLAVHEGRHVGQVTHFTTGTFEVFRYLLGEQAVGLGMGFYPTGWELEGDAVHSETDFSKSGRGRDPDFLMPYKADFLSGTVHSYDTYRFGSYYNFIPDKYAFGYIMETFMRDNSDYYVIGDIYHDYTRYWYDPSILNKAYQKYTGRTRRKNFHGAVDYFTQKWEKEYVMREPYTAFTRVSENSNDPYATYHSLMPVTTGGTVAVKSGMRHISQLVAIDTAGRERTIRPFAAKSLTSALVKQNDHTLVWSEIVAHPRWELKQYSVLRSYDLKTHRMRTLTRRTRYFNPAFSEDGSTVSVTEYPAGEASRVVLLDARRFRPRAVIAAPGGGQVHNTAWVGNRLYADAITGDGQWGLYSRPGDDENAEWEVEIAPQSRKILRLSAAGNRLLLESDVDGITNIFAFDPARHTLQKLTNARFGAFYPHLDADSGSLYYIDYDFRGYLPAKAARADLLWEDATMDNPYIFDDAQRFAAQSAIMAPGLSSGEAAALRAKVDSLPAKRYFKPLHLVNIHSWAPFYAGVERIMDMSYDHYYQLAAPGVTLVSQNKLGTAVTLAGYSYHGGRHAGHFNFQYSGLWPIFEINLDYNDRPRHEVHYGDGTGPIDTTFLSRPTLDLRTSVYTSINLSHGGWNSAIIPKVDFNWNQDLYGRDGNFHAGRDIQAGVRYYTMLPKTKQNRMPRLGIGAEVKGAYQMGPYDGDARVVYGYTYGYLPGFTLEQGWKLTLSGQKRFDSIGAGEFMKNMAKMPRGYREMPLNDYFKVTADYSIPIAVNDWHPVPILLYLMRVNVVPFADYAQNRTPAGEVQKLLSYGSVFTMQGHIFRIGWEVELGTRVSRYRDPFDGSWHTRAEFVTGVGL
ncbi:MAG: hypothetical protein IJR25_02255 [Bacteroidales bacterium]|nr:hypothetical protein [Bacteroidales bacterium]